MGNVDTDNCLPCQLRRRREAELASQQPAEPAPQKSAGKIGWTGAIVLENRMTGDGRIIQPNALRWDTLPIPLRWARSDIGAHDGAVVVGRINTLTRSGDRIVATGDFDAGSDDAVEAARQVKEGLTPGVSVDLDEVSFEVRVAQELIDETAGPAAFLLDDDEDHDHVGEEEREIADDGRVVMMRMKADDEVMVTTSARIRGATLVALPAFEEARVSLAAGAFAYNPHQARVPKGNGQVSGRWVDTPGTLGSALAGAAGLGGEKSGGPSESGKSSSSEVSTSLAQAAIEGGFTFDMKSGSAVTSGFSVARPGSYIVKADQPELVPAAIEQFLMDNPDVAHVGGWYDAANGEVVIDVVDIITDRDEAIRLATERNQQAIFDLDNLEEIDTGGTGVSENDRTFRRRDVLPGRGSARGRTRTFRREAGAGRDPDQLRRPARGATPQVRRRPGRHDHGQQARRRGPLPSRGRGRPRLNLARWRLARIEATNYGYNPSQARVPKGNGRVSGRWVDTPGSLGKQLGSAGGFGGPAAAGEGGYRDPGHAAEELYKKASTAEPKITGDISGLVQGQGGAMEGLQYRLKEQESLARKISGKVDKDGLSLQGAAESISDAVRYTGTWSAATFAASAQGTIDHLRSLGYEIRVKNTWGHETNPYRGINLAMITPDGIKVELQLHTPESFNLKNGEMHRLYELARVETDPVKIADLNAQMMALSNGLPEPPGVRDVK